jgi:hypothetical protein
MDDIDQPLLEQLGVGELREISAEPFRIVSK